MIRVFVTTPKSVLQFIADSVPFFRRTTEANADWGTRLPLRNLVAPRALDDCGAMCAAMIKANRSRQQSKPCVRLSKATSTTS